MIRVVKKMADILLVVAIIVIGGLGVFMLIPRLAGYEPYIVLSGSMEPTIHTGALAFIDTKDTEVEANDIIAFHESNGSVVTHRVMRLNDEGLYDTKGDANTVEDFNSVAQEQIIGTFAFSVPYAGYVLSEISGNTVNVAGFQISSAIILAISITVGLFVISTALGCADDN